ncbi:MAG: methyltransferase domain-containing protein [Anaerolineae bacterium]|uniref:class I SAM-dependent methyltransferase n=1 Tax=Promineifilum sp. TaxID=2664178 RepID=UPI001DA0F106|nr:methyltransferase domain-containing protein [Anaerolineales bacterium]MCO5179232.1 class I SAM-dependent methyltransferase [Promineifilum sp.]MCW5848367.1 methyltransferase domain-containing protein [Anaerolineae bacterium]
MNHDDHMRLLRRGVERGTNGVWAELGAGEGAFTLALAELLGPGATLHAVDRDRRALERGAAAVARRYPAVDLRPLVADFTGPLALPPLDGLLMANSLHFVRDKEPLLRRLGALLRPGGRFVLVEYNVDHGNRWVPHPLSFDTWAALAARAGLEEAVLLAATPSRFLGEIYSALAARPAAAILR